MTGRELRVKIQISFRKYRFVSVKYNSMIVNNKIHIKKIQAISFTHFKRELKAFWNELKISNIPVKLSGGAASKISSTYLK